MFDSVVTATGDVRYLKDDEIDEVTGAALIGSVVGLTIAMVTVYTVFRQMGYEAGKDQALRDNRADEAKKD